jgi:hypothetical protein
MTRIASPRTTATSRRRNRKVVAIEAPAVVQKRAKDSSAGGNVERPDISGEQTAAAETPGNANRSATVAAAIVTPRPKRRLLDGPPLSMELPQRDGDDYKRLKAAMARRLRGE